MITYKRVFLILFCLLFIPQMAFGLGGTQTLSSKTGTSVITEVRHYIGEASESFFSDARILEWIDAGTRDIVSQTKCLEFEENLELAGGTTSYALTSPHFGINEVLLYNIVSGDTVYKYLEPASPRVVGFKGDEAGEPVYWWERAGTIMIFPIPTSTDSGASLYVTGVSSPSNRTSSSSSIALPPMFENLLSYYVTAQALYRAKRFNEANIFMTQYNYWIALYRQQYINDRLEK